MKHPKLWKIFNGTLDKLGNSCVFVKNPQNSMHILAFPSLPGGGGGGGGEAETSLRWGQLNQFRMNWIVFFSFQQSFPNLFYDFLTNFNENLRLFDRGWKGHLFLKAKDLPFILRIINSNMTNNFSLLANFCLKCNNFLSKSIELQLLFSLYWRSNISPVSIN